MTMLKCEQMEVKEIPAPLERDECGEIVHSGALSTQQHYSDYTSENHAVWQLLFTTQRANLKEIAYPAWLEAIDKIGLRHDRIPKLSEIADILYPLTGWTPVPISGFLSAIDYFTYLSQRRFPTVTTLRPRESIDFIVEPDLFHDAFGHLPMHSHPVFAEFLQLFGKTAMRAKNERQLLEMQRLYWFAVEYCVIRVDGELKVCGSGHMSGIKESRYTLSDEVEKREFNLEDVVNQDFNPHVLQPVMFVIDTYEQLYDAMSKKAREF
jgi:phenylalanine-4-hydroxylase